MAQRPQPAGVDVKSGIGGGIVSDGDGDTGNASGIATQTGGARGRLLPF